MNIATTLKELRLQQNWSLKTLEKNCGVCYQQLYKIEKGESTPSITLVDKILKAYGKQLTITDYLS